MDGAFALKKMKQIIVVHNKLIIYNEEQFDMVICKNIEDAQRLHHTLAKIAKKQKFKGLLFMGTASKLMIGRMYDLIVAKTGWKIEKVRRTSTRP
jgi:chemotaxis methyl-accepting protein methylase